MSLAISYESMAKYSTIGLANCVRLLTWWTRTTLSEPIKTDDMVVLSVYFRILVALLNMNSRVAVAIYVLKYDHK